MSHHQALSPLQRDADGGQDAKGWLLATQPDPAHERILSLWDRRLTTMLPLGEKFSAVRIPSTLLCTATAEHEAPSGRIDEFLAHALDGGPAICDPGNLQYYVITPAFLPEAWQQGATAWRQLGIACLGEGDWVGVPGPARTTLDLDTYGLYWSVPLSDRPTPCEPDAVARLVETLFRAAGREVER